MTSTVFAFDDSGAPVGVLTYTTLVILHGLQFNKNSFQKLLPLAKTQNLRIVLLNRRQYPGSKAFSEAELRQYDGPDDHLREEFYDARAQELATFLVDFAIKEDIPKLQVDRSAGGIAVMGWSAGNALSLCLLSHANAINDMTREALEPFLRSIVMFDSPGYVVGRSSGPNEDFVLLDASLALEERVKAFGYWMSSYFDHPSVTSHKLEDLKFVPDGTEQVEATTSRMTEAEYNSIVSPEAGMKADVPAILHPLEEFDLRTKRALFDTDFANKYLPKVKVAAIWCERSVWTCVDCGWRLEELRKEYDALGVRGRPLRITMMPGSNHFPHWDEPEKTIVFLAKTVGEI